MKFKHKIQTLKSGIQICIRRVEEKEAQALLELKRAYIKNTTTIPMTLAEYPYDIDKEAALIKAYEKSKNSILLVAEIDGELIGNIDLTGSKRIKMCHTAMVGMGIKEQWRNQGLGKILINCILEWAKKQSEIEIVWLNVYASNELGCYLYKNTGFEVSGIVKDFFKSEAGYIDKIEMYQRIRKKNI
ncbi:MAG: GNAT family N-acetyltransferase [Chitinophagales bacterium]